MKLVPLGDQACLAYMEDEAAALRFAEALRRTEMPWLVDVVQAYSTVALYFDFDRIRYNDVVRHVGQMHFDAPARSGNGTSQLHRVPCCYELQLDMDRVMQYTEFSAEEIIRLHSQAEYTIYAIGFCPGFPYLGYLPQTLCGVPRLTAPRQRVEAGSVGLTGRQTGIYTEFRPGGWNIVGRTPLELVHVADGYFPLHTGDRVRFDRIDEAEFRQLQGQRL